MLRAERVQEMLFQPGSAPQGIPLSFPPSLLLHPAAGDSLEHQATQATKIPFPAIQSLKGRLPSCAPLLFSRRF